MFRLCQFIKDDGHPCQSPARRRLNFCHYHHERLIRERRIASARARYLHTVVKEASPYTLTSVEAALNFLKVAALNGKVDRKDAPLVLYGLKSMKSNLRYMAKHPGRGPSLRDLRQPEVSEA